METKQTTMAIQPYEEIIEQLQKESLVFVAYANTENKFLIAKGPYFDRYSLPCTRVTGTNAAYAYLNPILQKEFGINTRIKDYVELVRGFYKAEDKQYKIGNFICFLGEEYYEYPGKPNLTPNPEIFSDAKYVTLEEAKTLYSNGEITEYTMYYLMRIHDVNMPLK